MSANPKQAIRISLTVIIAMMGGLALGLTLLETSLAVGLSVLGSETVRKVFHL